MVNHAAGLEPPPRKGSSRFLIESLQNPSKGGPKKKEGDLFALVFHRNSASPGTGTRSCVPYMEPGPG